MPEMDGAELLRQIRESKPEMPVTIITGYPESDLMMKALDYGPLGVMKKPFKASDVLTNVRSYLRVGVPIKSLH
jgi:DNA-binding NarL/FixJ family response regulator